MRKRSRAVVVAVCAIGVGAAVGTAQADIPAPVFVSPPRHGVSSFDLDAGLDGRAVVTWTAADDRDVTRVWVSDRAPGGAFRRAMALSDRDRTGWNRTAAVGPDGTELVGWVEDRRASPFSFVAVAARRPGKGWSAVKYLATHARNASQMRLAFGADGTAAAAWVQDTADYVGRIAVAVRTPGGDWGKPELVTGAHRTARNPQVGVDGGGAVTLVWDRAPPPNKPTILRMGERPGGDGEVRAAVRPAGGRFGGAQVLSDPKQQATDAFLAENAHGDAAVVWRTLPTRRDQVHFRVAFAYRSGPGRFGPHHVLAGAPTHGFSFPKAAVAPDGTSSFVWGAQPTSAEMQCECVQIFAAQRPPGGPVGPPRAISGHAVIGPEIAAGPSGVFGLWTPDPVGRPNFQTRVIGRFLGVDGTLGPRLRLSKLGQGMDGFQTAAMSGLDRAVVTWTRFSKGRARLEVIETGVR